MDDRDDAAVQAVRLPVRLGVIGVGRPWVERYRPVAERRRDLVRIVAVHDAVAQRAVAEAQRWRAESVDGLRRLMRRPDVDGLVLFSGGWSDPKAVEFAAEAGLPCLVAATTSDLLRWSDLFRGGGALFRFEWMAGPASAERSLIAFADHVTGVRTDLPGWDETELAIGSLPT